MNRVFQSADILLPKSEIDMTKWSVVACDQFTSEPEYWEETDRTVGDAPSTRAMILPEVYLEAEDISERIQAINQTMEAYLAQGILQEYKDAMIYLERIDCCGHMRAGIVGKIDLEAYDFTKGSSSFVRATESTVTSRIPPRIKVREHASLELPHIMILVDDQEKTLIEPFEKKKDSLTKLYDFDLMQKGGHLTGYLLGEEEQQAVYQALEQLGDQKNFDEKYQLKDMPVLLYAMGDGNHSLATAKTFYENLKAANPGEDLRDHPARYALVELVNLHSPALEFEAIHRIVRGIDSQDLLNKMTEELELSLVERESVLEEDTQFFDIVLKGKISRYVIGKPNSKLTVGSVQTFLDQYLEKNAGDIDYIHGIDVLMNLSKEENSIGFILQDMGKEELFPTVILDGALPRKTFSMGHAQDKRYYMECRKIR